MVCALLTGTGELLMWTVWVGGSEVNSNLLTWEEAVSIASDWYARGYKDAVAKEVSNG